MGRNSTRSFMFRMEMHVFEIEWMAVSEWENERMEKRKSTNYMVYRIGERFCLLLRSTRGETHPEEDEQFYCTYSLLSTLSLASLSSSLIGKRKSWKSTNELLFSKKKNISLISLSLSLTLYLSHSVRVVDRIARWNAAAVFAPLTHHYQVFIHHFSSFFDFDKLYKIIRWWWYHNWKTHRKFMREKYDVGSTRFCNVTEQSAMAHQAHYL